MPGRWFRSTPGAFDGDGTPASCTVRFLWWTILPSRAGQYSDRAIPQGSMCSLMLLCDIAGNSTLISWLFAVLLIQSRIEQSVSVYETGSRGAIGFPFGVLSGCVHTEATHWTRVLCACADNHSRFSVIRMDARGTGHAHAASTRASEAACRCDTHQGPGRSALVSGICSRLTAALCSPSGVMHCSSFSFAKSCAATCGHQCNGTQEGQDAPHE